MVHAFKQFLGKNKKKKHFFLEVSLFLENFVMTFNHKKSAEPNELKTYKSKLEEKKLYLPKSNF